MVAAAGGGGGGDSGGWERQGPPSRESRGRDAPPLPRDGMNGGVGGISTAFRSPAAVAAA